jgi:hypothetical protein
MLFYWMHEDIETQKKGTVLICFLLGRQYFTSTKAAEVAICARTNTHAPKRVSAQHIFIGEATNPGFGLAINLYLKLADKEKRARAKIHFGRANGWAFVQCRLPSVSLGALFCPIGSHAEWIYTLMTYGIPHHLIPLTSDGKFKLKNHLASIEMRQAAEEYAQQGMVETCVLPHTCDVLLGKGKPIQQCTGNRRLHTLVDDHLSLYDGFSNKKEKTALSAEIVKMVQSASGRFLSKESGVWIKVSDDIAREKVSRTFRTRLRLMRRGRGCASNGIKVRSAIDPKSSAETNKRVKL